MLTPRALRLTARTLLRGCLLLSILAVPACSDEATVRPRTPARITAAVEVPLEGVVGDVLAAHPTVLVETRHGATVPGALVRFDVVEGGGTVDSEEIRTDAAGRASVAWRLGTVTGSNVLRASIAGGSVDFRVTSRAAGPAALRVTTQPSTSAHSGTPLWRQPVVQLLDTYGNESPHAGVIITASVGGNGTTAGATAATDGDGRAAFSALALHGDVGTHPLQFTAPGLTPASSDPVAIAPVLCDGPPGFPLDLALGDMARFAADSPGTPRCLEFDAGRNAGHRYLVLLENMQSAGDYAAALFPGSASGSSFTMHMTAAPVQPAGAAGGAAARRTKAISFPEPSAVPVIHGWDFGDGALHEGPPAAGGAITGGMTVPTPGDTISVWLKGVPRLGIHDAMQKAVVRFVSPHIVFAEDVRLGTTLTRSGGNYSEPLSIAQMDSIARAYAAAAAVQGDMLFAGLHNEATTAQGGRVTAVHTLMYDDNLWGYTFSTGSYFAFDYWAGTDGRTRGANQVPQRVADNLFMHEITHMRHLGMLQRASAGVVRGNQWLWEGFARFSERLPVAMRLLHASTPSRTSNFVLARNPVFGGTAYFMDDVPTYLSAGASFFDGYAASAYVFDYIADQVALQGRDPIAAVRDVALNGGSPAALAAALGRWLPGISAGELITRARIALYTDDIGVAGLPSWTQYHQYQLRASRPPGSRTDSDPRNAWPTVTPGNTYSDSRVIENGAAFGFVVDGTAGAVNTAVTLGLTAAPNAILSITRIR